MSNNKDLFKIGKLYQNIEHEVAWPLFTIDNNFFTKCKGRWLDPTNTFVAIEYVENPGKLIEDLNNSGYSWDSYKILFEDGNLYYITFSKVPGTSYSKSFRIVI